MLIVIKHDVHRRRHHGKFFTPGRNGQNRRSNDRPVLKITVLFQSSSQVQVIQTNTMECYINGNEISN